MGDPKLSLAGLKQEAVDGKVEERGLRSLTWRYFCNLLPAPTLLPSTPSSSSASARPTYSLLLSHSRTAHDELRKRYLRAPDGWRTGRLAGQTVPHPSLQTRRMALREDICGKSRSRQTTRWDSTRRILVQAWFENLDLRKMIRQDVQRTFSDIDYFRQAATQDRLTDILFVCCKLSPEIGYRQGMHELLAPLRLHVDFDSFPSTAAEDSLADVVLSHAHVEHDTLALLSPVMHSARICYDHTPYVRVSPKTSRQHVVPPPHPPRHRA